MYLQSNYILVWPFETTTVPGYEFLGSWLTLLILILILGICLLSRRKSAKIFEVTSGNLLLVSSLVWVAGVVLYIIGFYRPGLTWLAVVPRAIIASFKMFVVANEMARLPSDFQNDALFMSVFSVVHFSAALITFMFIFKMVGFKLISSMKILWHKWLATKEDVAHVFWGVNEQTCLLAEDIRRNHPDDIIIVIDVDDESEENAHQKTTLSHITNTITITSSEVARFNAIDALVDHCYYGPAALNGQRADDVFGALRLKNIGVILRKCGKSNFYFLSDDESQNISGALNLQQDKMLSSMEKNKPVIYVHARRDSNNEVFDHYSMYDSSSKRMQIKIVDSAYLSVSTLKQDFETLPLKCMNIDQGTGLVDSSFNALIIGFGSTGQEAFKYLYEYSAVIGPDMKRIPFNCYAVDEKMDKIAGLVKQQMPAIGADELELIHQNINSESFWETYKSLVADLNYVVISLNNDVESLTLAVNLFKYALKWRTENSGVLKFMIRCYDDSNENRMSEVIENLNSSVEGKGVEIRLFGRAKELYSCKSILLDEVLLKAKEFNNVYEGATSSADEQWKKNFGEMEIDRLVVRKNLSRYHAIYDVNRRIAQNLSNSLHCQTKLMLLGLTGQEMSDRLEKLYRSVSTRKINTTVYDCPEETAVLLINVAIVEHERWVASHKLMGYTYAPLTDLARKHHCCICPWYDLDEPTQSYDCNVVDTTIKMAYNNLKTEY